MGTESSRPTLRAMAEAKREQRERGGQAAPRIAGIERQTRFLRTAQEKQLVSLVEEERPRYITPAAALSPAASSANALPLVDPKTNKLNPLPATEVPGQHNSNNGGWNDAWIALLVRSGAVAPFCAEPVDEDPLSAGTFVSFMMDFLNPQNQQQKQLASSSSAAAAAAAAASSSSRSDPLAPPPPRPEEELQQQQREDSWVLIETAESSRPRRPVVPASAPWPLEECCCCLQFFPGLNYCSLCCHGGVCTRCLLHIIKPSRFDASNDAAVKRALVRQKQLVADIKGLISEFERERSPPPELISLDEVARSVSDAFEKAAERVSGVGVSISNFLRETASASSKYAVKGRSPSNSNSSSRKNSPALAAASSPTAAATTDIDEAEYRMSKEILALASRIETLGLFACAPTRGNNNGDDDDDDDAANNYNSSRNSSFSSQTDAAARVLSSHGAGAHQWPVPDSYSFDDCSAADGASARALLDKVCVAVMRAIRVGDRGACPLCSSKPTAWIYAGRRPRMMILKDLAAYHGCDERVLEAFASGGLVEQHQKQRQQQLSSPSSSPNGGGNRSSSSGEAWAEPTESDEREYELCVALSLSAVADAQLEMFRAGGGDDAAAVVTADAESDFLDRYVQWAAPCRVCKHVCWKEFRCRVCGVLRGGGAPAAKTHTQ